MKRILRLSTLAGAITAAVWLASFAPVSQREAKAQISFGITNGGVYYGGGREPYYGGYSGYGYSPYGGGAYTYVAPRVYVQPSYRDNGFGNAYGTGAIYSGTINYGYGGSGRYGQRYRPAYNPYGYGGGYGGRGGYGGYGPYGY